MKSENFIRSIHGLFDKRFKMALLSAMMVAWISSVNAQCPLACNDLVQISMDDDCNVTITPDVMLEGQGVNPNCNYTVTVYNVNGTPVLIPSSRVLMSTRLLRFASLAELTLVGVRSRLKTSCHLSSIVVIDVL
jgi:hypothetical protein